MAKSGVTLKLTDPTKRSGKSAGQLAFSAPRITERYSFLDYLQAGVSIDFFVGIDFTASNGAPEDPASLHHGAQTPYENALQGVASILDFYNPTKCVSVLVAVERCFARFEPPIRLSGCTRRSRSARAWGAALRATATR